MTESDAELKQRLAELPSLIGKHVIHRGRNQTSCTGVKWNYEFDNRDVILIAIHKTSAWVRRPGRSLYTAATKDIFKVA